MRAVNLAPRARELTPIILAIGLATAVNIITLASLWDALNSDGPGLSENATQVLTTAFGGIIGVLGATLGYKQGTNHAGGGVGPDGIPRPPGQDGGTVP